MRWVSHLDKEIDLLLLRFQLCFVDEVHHIVQQLARGGGHVDGGEGQTLHLQQQSWNPLSRCAILLLYSLVGLQSQARLLSPLSKARSSPSQAANPWPTGSRRIYTL